MIGSSSYILKMAGPGNICAPRTAGRKSPPSVQTKSKPPWRDTPLRLYPRRALLAGNFPGDSPAL